MATGTTEITNEHELLDTDEAAQFLRTTRASLERWRSTGDGPEFLKLGRQVRYERRALADFIARSRRKHTGQATTAA